MEEISNNILPTINRIYNSIVAEEREKVFFGDVSAAQSILLCISQNVFDNISVSNIELCNSIYFETWNRITIGIANKRIVWLSNIKESLTTGRFNNIPVEIVAKIIDESFQIILSHFPQYESDYYAAAAINAELRRNSSANESVQDLYLTDKEYGLVPNKPIFVNGFSEFNRYINSLVTDKKEKLNSVRKGSMKIDGIEGPVDVVETFLSNGELYGRIYVCVYSYNAVLSVPEGYLIIDEDKTVNSENSSVNIENNNKNDFLEFDQTISFDIKKIDSKESRRIIRKISDNPYVKKLKEIHYEHSLKSKINLIILVFVFLFLPTFFIVITHVMATDNNNTVACIIILATISLCYLVFLFFIPMVTLRDNFNEFCLKVISMCGNSYVSAFEMLSRMQSSYYFKNFFFNSKYILTFNAGLNNTKITFNKTSEISSIVTDYDNKSKSWKILLKFLNGSVIVLPLKTEKQMTSFANEIAEAWRVSKL